MGFLGNVVSDEGGFVAPINPRNLEFAKGGVISDEGGFTAPINPRYLADGGVVDPVRDWLKKHNELNQQLNRTVKVEPMMRFANGGFVNSIVAGDQPYRMADGGSLGGFVKGLASIGPLLDVVKNLSNQGFKI